MLSKIYKMVNKEFANIRSVDLCLKISYARFLNDVQYKNKNKKKKKQLKI